MNEPQLNIRQLLIIALATTDRVHHTIDSIYNENKDLYYETYEKSGFKDDAKFSLHPVRYKEYFVKVVGIVEDDYKKNSTLKIERIIKKGWSVLYNEIKNNQIIKHSNIQSILFGLPKNKVITMEDMQKVSEFELNNNYIIFLYLTRIFNDKKVESALYSMFQAVSKADIVGFDTIINRYTDSETKLTKEDKDILFGKQELTINDFLDMVIENELNDKIYNGNMLLKSSFLSFEEQQMLRNKLFTDGKATSSLIGFYSGFLKRLGYGETKFNVFLDKKFLMKFFESLNDIYKRNNLNKKHNKMDIIVSCMFLVGVLKEYEFLYENQNKLSEEKINFLKSDKENKLTLELENVTNQNNDLIKQNQMLENDLKNTNTNINEINREKESLLNEIEKLKTELKNKNDDLIELTKIRNYIFESNKENENEIEDTNENQNYIVELNSLNKKFVIIGGHPIWQNKLKNVLNDNFSFIDIEKVGKISSNINNFDYIIFNTSYNSHQIYNKVVSQLKNKNKIFYINSKVNLNTTLEKILKIAKIDEV